MSQVLQGHHIAAPCGAHLGRGGMDRGRSQPAALMGSSRAPPAPRPHGACTPLSPGADPPAQPLSPVPLARATTQTQQRLRQLLEVLERPLLSPTLLCQKGSEGIPQTVSQKILPAPRHPCGFQMCDSGTASLLSPPPTTEQAVPWACWGHGVSDGSSLARPVPGVGLIGTSGLFVSALLATHPIPAPQVSLACGQTAPGLCSKIKGPRMRLGPLTCTGARGLWLARPRQSGALT